MEHFTDNPVLDAQSHIHEMDEKTHQYDHECNACKEGFDSGHGVQIGDEKFCNSCIDHFEHFAFYRNLGISDRDIYNETEKTTAL